MGKTTEYARDSALAVLRRKLRILNAAIIFSHMSLGAAERLFTLADQ
jgi:hypothetical protein